MATGSGIGVGATNITTLGTLTTGTWNATVVGLTYGGTAANLTASNGGIVYSTASALAILSGTATANQMLLSGSNAAPSWSSTTWPQTTTTNQILYATSTNTIGGLAVTNAAALCTDGSGVPTWVALTNGQVLIGNNGNAPTAGVVSVTGGSVTTGAGTFSINGQGNIINQNSSSVTAAAGCVYLINNGASLVTITLPPSPAAGDYYAIIGNSSGGWKIVYNTSQFITLPGGTNTTTSTGNIASNNQYDCVLIRFTETSNNFQVVDVTGSPSYA